MHKPLRSLLVIGIGTMAINLCSVSADDPPCELGKVNWQRDLRAAKASAAETGRPILILFQEVPGCQTCQDFGNQPLSHPLMVEAMEDLFIPVLVYNNKPEDEATLQAFGEPSWNNPVIRYVDHDGKDLIERKDGIWNTIPTAARMVAALEQAGRQVPVYLKLLAAEAGPAAARATFAMHCFWDGEAKIGKLTGVQATRSAWVGNKEIVEVAFDPSLLDYQTLLDQARSMECASTVFTHDDQQHKSAAQKVGDQVVDARQGLETRAAKPSDQKYYLRHSLYRHLPLTEMQAVKINAHLFGKPDHEAVRRYLSPRQLKLLAAIERRLADDPDALQDWVFLDHIGGLDSYDQKLRQALGL